MTDLMHAISSVLTGFVPALRVTAVTLIYTLFITALLINRNVMHLVGKRETVSNHCLNHVLGYFLLIMCYEIGKANFPEVSGILGGIAIPWTLIFLLYYPFTVLWLKKRLLDDRPTPVPPRNASNNDERKHLFQKLRE